MEDGGDEGVVEQRAHAVLLHAASHDLGHVGVEAGQDGGGRAQVRKAAGLERRMSYISRSVEKAAQEQDLMRAHQVKKQERKNTMLRLPAPLDSQRSTLSVSRSAIM